MNNDLIKQARIFTSEEQARALITSLADALEHEEGETERLNLILAACGVAAHANTQESADATRRDVKEEYRHAALSDVQDAVDREMALRADLARVEASRVFLVEQSEHMLIERNRLIEERDALRREHATCASYFEANVSVMQQRIDELTVPDAVQDAMVWLISFAEARAQTRHYIEDARAWFHRPRTPKAPIVERCEACEGNGWVWWSLADFGSTKKETCLVCNGTGRKGGE